MTDIARHINEIYNCLDPENPQSFFLFAGAGSGKTRTLVNVLERFKKDRSDLIKLKGQKIGIITYTNAACDEIKERLDYDPVFSVSTIHSFAWMLIQTYQKDIKDWIKVNTQEKLVETIEKEKKGRLGTKASLERQEKIKLLNKRLINLREIKYFTYNPNGANNTKNSLDHDQVIKITAEFLSSFDLMQKILIKKYPFLLIDESQDTHKILMEAFLQVQNNHKRHFALGLFGDAMQRIYGHGKKDLDYSSLPEDWIKPAIKENHRSPERIISLINDIRSCVPGDAHKQEPGKKKGTDGFVRFFIVNSGAQNKIKIESEIAYKMAMFTQDSQWKNTDEVKTLLLEHKMSARRGNFSDFFEPLYDGLKGKNSGLLDGTLTGMSLLTKQIIPLFRAKKEGNDFAVAQIVKRYCPLLQKDTLKIRNSALDNLRLANNAVNELYNLYIKNKENITAFDILKKTAELKLFNIPDTFLSIINISIDEFQKAIEDERDELDRDTEAWRKALASPFKQLFNYAEYIDNKSRFGTHQGVKGLEFPRVMVVIDDAEAGGFLYKYEDLMKEVDIASFPNAIKESGADRARRLFYVTCSRAEESLAIVMYSNNAASIARNLIRAKWFSEEEVVIYGKQ
jgi:DNA helicase-2/ATP-dependent DNA helicase PcrA